VEELSEAIEFPRIATLLVAYYWYPRGHRDERIATWRVDMHFPAPDARYRGALAVLGPAQDERRKSHEQFLSELREGLAKIEALAERDIPGEYRRSVAVPGRSGSSCEPTLEIVAGNSQIGLWVSASSSTGHTFHYVLNVDEVRRAIDVLNGVPTRAQALTETLISLA
jgi:hypothetical protein